MIRTNPENVSLTYSGDRSARSTNYCINLDLAQYLIKKSKTITFQKSYFNHNTCIWKSLAVSTSPLPERFT